MTKLRIKLTSGRILGPLIKEQIIELYQKGYISGKELCQVFPNGEWKVISLFFSAEELISENKQQQNTNIIDIVGIHQKEANEKLEELEGFLEDQKDNLEEFRVNPPEKINEEDNKTTWVKNSKIREFVKPINTEINKDNQNIPLKEENIIEENNEEHASVHKISQHDEVELSAKTISFKFSKKPSADEIAQLEEEAIKEEENANNSKVLSIDTKASNESKIITAIKNVKQKKMSWIVALSFIAVIYLLLFDEQVETNIPPKLPAIIYPISLEKVDVERSVELYREGIEYSKKISYFDKMKASELLRKSLQLNRDDKVLGKLVLIYAELLEHVVNYSPVNTKKDDLETMSFKERSGNVLYKLIKEGRYKSLSNIDIVIGTALFYKNFGKYSAAISTLLRYQIKGGKPNLYYFSLLLDLLRLDERMDLAKLLYEKLAETKDKGPVLVLSLSRYLLTIGEHEQAGNLLLAELKRYKDSVELLLEYANVLVAKNDFEQLPKIIKRVKELRFEYSPRYYGEYLKFAGIIEVTRKNYLAAADLFKKSLHINEDIELRVKLAKLEEQKDSDQKTVSVNNLIIESKVLNLIRKAKDAKENYQYEKAFSYAIDAVDSSENSIKSKIFLSELQVERGYFSEAIKTLNELHSNHPLINEITLALIRAHIEAYKFKEALQLLVNVREGKLARSAEYASLNSYLYFKMDEPLQAELWLKKSLRLNPLNDYNYYLLAKLMLKQGKFMSANSYIVQAVDMNPENIEYKIQYSEVIYYLKGVEAAIGYLNSLLNNSVMPLEERKSENTDLKITSIMREIAKVQEKDISRVLSEIAIYYYRSGQISMFNKYKDRLDKEFNGSKVFYDFLIKAAKIDDKHADVYKYYRLLVNLDPGDLNAKMDFGKFLVSQNKLDEALEMFFAIRERLNSYPKVLYYISKIYLLKGDMGKAQEFAELEVESSPNLEYGSLLLGDIFFKEGKFKEARESYKKAQQRNFNSIDAIIGLANIDYEENQLDRATELYLRASKSAPNNPFIWRQLGLAYKTLGQRSLAIQAFEQFLKLAPDAEDAAKIKEILEKLKNF